MKRTTLFIEAQHERELQALARRSGRPMAALVREAVAQYIVTERGRDTGRLAFVAAGRSGHTDTAERHEALLFESERPAPSRPARRTTRRAPRA